jgi:hypothetical protein
MPKSTAESLADLRSRLFSATIEFDDMLKTACRELDTRQSRPMSNAASAIADVTNAIEAAVKSVNTAIQVVEAKETAD